MNNNNVVGGGMELERVWWCVWAGQWGEIYTIFLMLVASFNGHYLFITHQDKCAASVFPQISDLTRLNGF